MEESRSPVEIVRLAIIDLSFDPSNARKHSDSNLAAIKGSLRKFGQQKPIVIDRNNVVIAGNGTLEAAKSLGWTEISVVKTELTGPEAMAFALADNRTAELAKWDDFILAQTLKSLSDINFDISEIGFDIKTDNNDDDIDSLVIDDDNAGESSSLKVKCTTIDEIDHLREIFGITKKSNEISYNDLIAKITK